MHELAIGRITKYLASMSTYVDLPDVNQRLTKCSVVYRTDTEKGIKCYTDSKYVSGWAQADADNAENVMSHTGYVITYS